MAGPTQDELRTVLDAYVGGGTWQVCMAAVGRKEKTAFSWLHKSQRAERLRQLDSPFFLKWNCDDDVADDPDEKPDWFHNHMRTAGRGRRTMVYETILINQAIRGVEEIVRDGNGRVVWQLDERFIGLSNDEVEIMFGIPAAEIDFYRIKRDENKMPLPEVRVNQLPATIRQAVLRGLMPSVYGDHSTLDVKSESRVLVQHQFLRRPSAPSPQAVASPSEPLALPAPAQPVKEESEAVKKLREQLRASLAGELGPKKPEGKVAIIGVGEAPDRVSTYPADEPQSLADHPRAYEVPKPAPASTPAPNFSRPAERIDRPGLGSRSNPPPGGMRVR